MVGLDGEQSGNGRRELWWRTMDGGVEKRRGQLRSYGISRRRALATSREGAESRSDEDTGTVAPENRKNPPGRWRRSWRDTAKKRNARTTIRVAKASDTLLRDGRKGDSINELIFFRRILRATSERNDEGSPAFVRRGKKHLKRKVSESLACN